MNTERIEFDIDLQKNVDNHLEVVYHEVHTQNISDAASIAFILDEYVTASFGAGSIPFRNALGDLRDAIKWATQFGPLQLLPLSKEAADAIERDEITPIHWQAVIGPGNEPNQASVVGETLEQTIVLAGVQVLREYAYTILNPADATAH